MKLAKLVLTDAIGRRAGLVAPLAIWGGALVVAWFGRARGVDALMGSPLSYLLPLHVLAVVHWLLGRRGLNAAASPFVALGYARREVVRTQVLVVCTVTAASSTLLGVCAALLLRSPSGDVVTCTWLFALGGVTLATLLVAGCTWFRGRGAGGVLVLNWVMGGAGSVGILFPQGHLARLAGGVPVAGLGGRASWFALVAMCVVYASISIWRGQRTQA
jgi:hypothetical protein